MVQALMLMAYMSRELKNVLLPPEEVKERTEKMIEDLPYADEIKGKITDFTKELRKIFAKMEEE
jgi:hypothetical protein